MKQSPALFTRASTPPNFALMLLKTSAILSAEVRSTLNVVTFVEKIVSSFLRFSEFRSRATT